MKQKEVRRAARDRHRTGQDTDTIIQFLIVVYSIHTVRSLQKQQEHDSVLKNSDCGTFDLCLGSYPPPWLLECYSVAKNGPVSIFRWKR